MLHQELVFWACTETQAFMSPFPGTTASLLRQEGLGVFRWKEKVEREGCCGGGGGGAGERCPVNRKLQAVPQ